MARRLLVGVLVIVGALALGPARPARAVSLDDILKGLILLDDDAAEQIISALGSAEVERKGVSTDPQLNARADRIFRRVVAGAPRKDYQFKVLNDSTVNAYAVLGGHLYVNRGLLSTPGVTDHEIAAVIGHEIAHIERRHGLKQIRQQLLIGYAAGKIGRDGEKAALVALAGQLYLSGRSQSDEKEADLEGARLARQAGYNPTGAVAFMRRLEVLARNERSRHQGGSPLLAQLEQRLSTHPPTDRRCEYLKDDLFRSKYGSDFRIASAGNQRPARYASTGRGRDKILLSTGPHHIGDDQAGISTIWSTTFDLTEADLAGRTGAKVVFLLRSTEIRRDPNVYFNRVKVGFAVTQSRNWERFEFPTPLTALHPGRNLIDIETIIPDLWRTYDDCEFKHVYLVFEGHAATASAKKADRGLGVPLVIHFHTTFSDGSKPPQEVKWGLENDVNGVIVTDHAWGVSEIGSPTHEVNYVPGVKPQSSYGYPNYVNTVSQLTSNGFLCLPGAEISVFYKDGGVEKEGHLLLLDISDRSVRRSFVYDETGKELSGLGCRVVLDRQMGEMERAHANDNPRRPLVTLEGVLRAAGANRIASVAAHPANFDYEFPLDLLSEDTTPTLLEFFNTGVSDLKKRTAVDRRRAEAEGIAAYLRLLRAGRNVGVTAGSDYHTDLQNGGLDKAGSSDQWHRYTYLCGTGPAPSRAEVMDALWKGRTYALVEDAACEELSPLPGFDQKVTSQIRIRARLRRGTRLRQWTQLRAYLDLVPTKVFLYRIDRLGDSAKPYWSWDWPLKDDVREITFDDFYVEAGHTYTYVLYAPYQFVTSPINLRYEP